MLGVKGSCTCGGHGDWVRILQRGRLRLRRLWCRGDCGGGDGAVVGSFKHSEVFKEMIFTFAVVGSGGCGGFGGGDRRGG